ncbi:MAG: hypothetical protein EOO63_09250 [Hymenobacter sp.]|nr:MAG: hypothetical protein EOO63_09250 [Hymenobacter sp.]
MRDCLAGETGVAVLRLDDTLNRQSALCLNSESTAGEVQPDGKLLIGGTFTTVNGTSAPRLARLLSTGLLDPGFTLAPGGFNGTVTSMQVQPDGKILVGGDFTSYGGTAQAHLVRLLPTGGLGPSFQAAIAPAAFFNGFAVQSDGKVVVNAISLAAGEGLFRLLPMGSHDNTFVSSTYFLCSPESAERPPCGATLGQHFISRELSASQWAAMPKTRARVAHRNAGRVGSLPNR